MDEQDALARLEALQAATGAYRPLTEAADEYQRFAETPGLRIYTGIPEFDAVMRGTAPGELTIIQGFAANGKTVLATELMMNNTHEPLVLYTPDETRVLVLTKLASAETGISADEFERQLFRENQEYRDKLREVAERYHKLVVYDDSVTLHSMDRLFDEAERGLGERPKGVIFDYVEQLADAIDVKAKIDGLKRWGKEHNVAMIILNQVSRTSGAGGKRLAIDSGMYGGESQATHMIGVRRKKNYYWAQIRDIEERLDQATNPQMIQRLEQRLIDIRYHEMPRHEDTVSFSLLKNKRPPGTLLDEIDFRLDPQTGRIYPIGGGEPGIPSPDDWIEGGGSATEFLRNRES